MSQLKHFTLKVSVTRISQAYMRTVVKAQSNLFTIIRTSNQLEQMAEQKAVKDKDEEAFNNDWKENFTLLKKFQQNRRAF